MYHYDLIAPDEPLGFLCFENITPISNASIAQHSEVIHWSELINGGQPAVCWHLLRKAARPVPRPSTFTIATIATSAATTNNNNDNNNNNNNNNNQIQQSRDSVNNVT